MTEIMIQTAEEEFANRSYTAAYKWAVSAKIVDPFYPSLERYLEAYRVHWAAAKRKTPTGEIDWYAVLDIKERLWRSYKMITHTYVQLAKKIHPDVHCSAAAPGSYSLITTAWEILSEPQSRLAYHARAGFPPPTCSSPEEEDEQVRVQPQFRIKKPEPDVAVEKVVSCAPKRRREERPDHIPVTKVGYHSPKRRREECPGIAVKKVRYAPTRHRVGCH